MKSVGEVMAIGRTFSEALNKAIRGLGDWRGWLWQESCKRKAGAAGAAALNVPTAQRLWAVAEALRTGLRAGDVAAQAQFDPWFVQQMAEMLEVEAGWRQYDLAECAAPGLAAMPSGWASRMCRSAGHWCQARRPLSAGQAVRARRLALGIRPSYYRVDTCAAEFEAFTPYFYSTYESERRGRSHRAAQGH